MKNILIITFSVLFATINVWAQPGKFKNNASGRLAQTDDLLQKGNYFEAAILLKNIVEANDKNTAAHWKLANCAALLHDYRTATQQYKYVYEQISPSVRAAYPNAGFFYAKMLKQLGNYETARGVFARFIEANQMNTDPQTARFIALAKVERDGCGLETSNYSNLNATCSNIGKSLNGAYNEGGASFAASDKMLYAGIKMNTPIRESNKNKAFAKLYEAAQTGTSWGDLQPLAASINAPDIHNAHPALSPDGKRLYFTRSALVNGKMRAEVYMSPIDNGVYGAPIRLEDDFNLLGTSNTMPFIMNAGRGDDLIYFASTRSGGKGGYDIWKVIRHPEGTYERFENVANINTLADEIAPFMDIEGKLFFSSDGHPGFGGLDVFSYEVIEQEPIIKNLGKPINSAADDFGFSTDKTTTNGLLISNRVGSTTFDAAYPNASDDIFMVKIDRAKPVKTDPNIIADITTPTTETTKRIIDGVEKTSSSTKIDGKTAANTNVDITINIDNDTNFTTNNMADTSAKTDTSDALVTKKLDSDVISSTKTSQIEDKITEKIENYTANTSKNTPKTDDNTVKTDKVSENAEKASNNARNTPTEHDPNAQNTVFRDADGNFVYSNGNIIDKKGNMIDRKGNIIAKNFEIRNKNGNITDKNGKVIYTPREAESTSDTNNSAIVEKEKTAAIVEKEKTAAIAEKEKIAAIAEKEKIAAIVEKEKIAAIVEKEKATNSDATNTNLATEPKTLAKADKSAPPRVSGSNYNNKNRNTVSADACAKATLYDVSNGVTKVVKEIPCANENNTDFALAPNKKYVFALEKAGETLQMREISTLGSRRSEIFRPRLDNREVNTTLPSEATANAGNNTTAAKQGEKFTFKGNLAANDGSTNKLAGAEMILYKIQNETQVTEIARQPLASDNTYSFEVEHGTPYKIVAEKPGYLTVSQEFTANKAAPVFVNSDKMVLREKKNNVAYTVKDINYEFGTFAPEPEGLQNLDGMVAMLRDNATIIVEISAHTDNVGAAAVNQALSQKRAQAVVDYLTSKGVDKSRLKAQGYGSTKPIATNANEAGRSRNRRTEFKLVGEVK